MIKTSRRAREGLSEKVVLEQTLQPEVPATQSLGLGDRKSVV